MGPRQRHGDADPLRTHPNRHTRAPSSSGQPRRSARLFASSRVLARSRGRIDLRPGSLPGLGSIHDAPEPRAGPASAPAPTPPEAFLLGRPHPAQREAS